MRAPALALILVAGCAPTSEPAVTAWLRVAGAELHAGPPPGDGGGPAVTGVDDPQFEVWRGQVGKALGGSLARGGTAALLYLDGDRGHWVVGAGVPDISAPDQPVFHCTVEVAAAAPLGPRDLLVSAVDAAGRVGPARKERLVLYDREPPAGALVFTLAWDRAADLDLHLVTPAGVEIWARHPYEVDSSPDADPPGTVGRLDADAGAGCVDDGRRQESVSWPAAPAPGHYLVRVDTPSLCGAPFVDWSLTATRDGAVVGAALGQSGPADTRHAGERGDGLLALELDVP